MHTFFITPGELHGVGLEVTLKSLPQQQSSPHRYIVWTNKNYCLKYFPDSKIPFFNSIESIPHSSGVYFLNSSAEPVDWFKNSVDICMSSPKKYGLITGSLEKKSFLNNHALGHTEYLRFRFPNLSLYMTFFGDLYNCLLLTDHNSLKEVPGKLSTKLIREGLLQAISTKERLSLSKPLLLLGLNPHAGENGLLGKEEDMHKEALKGLNIKGPYPPDGLFGVKSYEGYSFIIANYHDQGLIPFKALNGFNAAQATLGLPFVRTSVDHGTASDIFGKGLANATSMKKAIVLAEELL